MLNLLPFRDAKRVKHGNHAVGTEQPHQIVFQRDKELGFAGITLTTASTTQLVVNTSGLMPLRADDHKTARRSRLLVQLDIRTTTRHVGGDGNCAVNAGVRHDLRLQLVELGVQHLMLQTVSLKDGGKLFRSVDIDRAHQNGLSLGVRLLYRMKNSLEFFFSCFIDSVLLIDTCHRLIRGDRYHIHAVNVTELLFLRERRTCHARFFLKFIKEILESNVGERLALPLHLHMLLRLNRLMQTVGITTSRHDTPGKLVHDHNLIILHHIILIAEHQVMRPQSQYDVVLDFQIFRVGKILDLEETLHLGNALRGQVHHLVLLVHDKVPGFFPLHAHDGVHLGQFFHVLTAGELFCQNIARLVKFRGLTALPGYDQRGSRLVDQHRVHLIDDGIVKISEHELFLVDDHIVSQIVKAKLIVGHIGNVTVVRLSALL